MIPTSLRKSAEVGLGTVNKVAGASAMPAIDTSEKLGMDVATEPNEPPGSPA